MKKIIISAAILLLTGATAFAVNHYQKSLSDNLDPLTKANIEAMRTITTPSTSTGTTSSDIGILNPGTGTFANGPGERDFCPRCNTKHTYCLAKNKLSCSQTAC